MTYRFLGQPDRLFPKLKRGCLYKLGIEEVSKGGFINWILGNTRPVIVTPFRCPYSSWESFYRNWKLVK